MELHIFSNCKSKSDSEVLDDIRKQAEMSIESGMDMNRMDQLPILTMDALRVVWGHLREKYETSYKMSTDVLDIDSLANDISSLDGFCGEVATDKRHRLMKVRFSSRTWYIKWRGYQGFQLMNISPFKDLPKGSAPLCSTYKIPQMLEEAESTLDKIENMFEEIIENVKKKRVQERINSSTAEALAKEALDGICEYKVSCRKEGGQIVLSFNRGRSLTLRFTYEQMYQKIPLMTEVAKGMSCLWKEFGEDFEKDTGRTRIF